MAWKAPCNMNTKNDEVTSSWYVLGLISWRHPGRFFRVSRSSCGSWSRCHSFRRGRLIPGWDNRLSGACGCTSYALPWQSRRHASLRLHRDYADISECSFGRASNWVRRLGCRLFVVSPRLVSSSCPWYGHARSRKTHWTHHTRALRSPGFICSLSPAWTIPNIAYLWILYDPWLI